MNKTKLKILYAEDEESVAKSLTRMLSTIADIDYATNGQEALKLYTENLNQYDIVLTDIKMPQMSGIELLQNINEMSVENFPKKIITTAYNDTDFLIEAIELKVDKFLIKPINIDVLFEYIDELIESKENRIELIQTRKNFDDYKQIVEKHSVISATDKDGQIIYVNENFATLSGYSKEELLGKNHNIVRHPNTDKEFYKNLWDTISQKKIYETFVENMKKDGKSFWLRGIISPILDTEENIKEFIFISQDVTKEVMQQKKLENMKEIENLENIKKAVKVNTQETLDLLPCAGVFFSKDSIKCKNRQFEEIFLLKSEEDILEVLVEKNSNAEMIFLDELMVTIDTVNYKLLIKQIDTEDYLALLIRN